MKKLYRSEENKIVSGILGGIAEYIEIDPVVIRVLFVLITLFTGFFPGAIFYGVCLFIIPKKPISQNGSKNDNTSDTETVSSVETENQKDTETTENTTH